MFTSVAFAVRPEAAVAEDMLERDFDTAHGGVRPVHLFRDGEHGRLARGRIDHLPDRPASGWFPTSCRRRRSCDTFFMKKFTAK